MIPWRRLAFCVRHPASAWADDRLSRRQLCARLALVWMAGAWGGCSTTREPHLDPAEAGRVLRVACVGDSITFGAGVEDRESNCYPAVLGRLLGEGFETRNYGVNGATLSRAGDGAYWNLPQFAELERWRPDAVVLKLGTNDTKPQNWRSGEYFRQELRAWLDRFAGWPQPPRVWLCLPVPVYETRWGINEATLAGEVIPAIRSVAVERKLPLIDLHTALSDRPEFFPDRIHPNGAGAAMIAIAVSVALKGRHH